MQFRVLGTVEALDDAEAPIRLGSGRERLVLALLLVGADRLVPTEQLIDSLWNDPPPTARQQLQNLIAGLRRRLAPHGPGLITTRPFGYELRMAGHTLDLAEFRRLVVEGRAHRAAGDEDDVAATIGRAVALWRGEPLGDAVPSSSDSGTEALIQGLAEERNAAVELLLESLAATGRHEEVLTGATTHLAADPWNERLHEHRIRALAATGRRQEASDTYRQVRRQFLDEIGVEPGRGLRDLNARIIEGLPVSATQRPRRPVPRELPAMTWTLVGREALLASVGAELARRPGEGAASGPPSIVVLVGVGGVGKTALAVAAGHQLADAYPDGTLHADLGAGPSGPADGHEVVGRFLRALGVEHAAIPADPEERVALYRSTIDRKRLLVVLDDATSEAQVRRLLPTSPGSGALVTSRSKLAGLPGVRRHTIPPLAPEDATSMLVELSGVPASGDEADVLAQISTLCGHLPLALCVAAAKLATHDHLGLGDLRDRLSDEHARLDELSVGDIDVRASITASVTDLPADAATLFRRLALAPAGDWPAWVAPHLLASTAAASASPGDAGAPGGRSPDGAYAGSRAPAAASRALDVLIDRHLVEPIGRDTAGQPRYRIHSLVAELAQEALAAAEPGSRGPLALDLARAWLELAERADAHLDPGSGAAPPATSAATRAASERPVDWFESERLNVVGAVHTAVALEDRELAARLALAIRTFLTIRAYDDERERVLRIALDDYPEVADQRLAAQLLAALFGVLAQERRLDELPDVASRLLDAARRVGDEALEQRALSQLGWAAMARHDVAASLDWYEQGSALAARRGDPAARAMADGQRGVLLRNTGRPSEGDPLLATAVAASRESGSRRSTCIWLVTRAEGLIDLDRPDDAQVLLEEALDLARQVRDDLGEAHCHLALARAHLGRGALVHATNEYDAARPRLDAHARSGEDLDALRLGVDLDAAAGRWSAAQAGAERLVAARRAAGDDLQLAADLARLDAVAAGGACGALDGEPGQEPPTEPEYGAILRRLALPLAALRLPRHLRDRVEPG